MDSRSLSLVVITVGVAGFVNFGHASPILDSLESSSEISKVFLDCKHSDYRTYIQCLKRQKRDRHYSETEMDHPCMETCIKECVRDRRPCDEVCIHCLTTSKKTKHHTINITETEYETECVSGNCTKVSPQKPVIVNVTNEIHIHNYYNRSVEVAKSPAHCPCYYVTWQPCYCRPQLPICQYQQQWPCIPYGGVGAIGGGIGGGMIGGLGGGMIGGFGGGMVSPMVGTVIGQPGNTCTCGNEATTCDECNPAAG